MRINAIKNIQTCNKLHRKEIVSVSAYILLFLTTLDVYQSFLCILISLFDHTNNNCIFIYISISRFEGRNFQ